MTVSALNQQPSLASSALIVEPSTAGEDGEEQDNGDEEEEALPDNMQLDGEEKDDGGEGNDGSEEEGEEGEDKAEDFEQVCVTCLP